MTRLSSCALHRDCGGVIFVEVLISFVPLWTLFLCAVQLAFISQANLTVKHAADSAARSAVVVLPDDPEEYGGEQEMSVARNSVTAADVAGALGRMGSLLQGGATTRSVAAALSDRVLLNLGRSRLNTIRLAAHVPLMPLAPVNVGHDDNPSLAKTVGGTRKLLSALYYQPFAVAVTFPGLTEDVATGPEITVRVTYAYQCTVPLARRILCRAADDLDGREALESAFFPLARTFVGGRFRALQRETTLMIHRAPYEYVSRGS